MFTFVRIQVLCLYIICSSYLFFNIVYLEYLCVLFQEPNSNIYVREAVNVDVQYWQVTWFFSTAIVSKFRFLNFCEYKYVIYCGNNAPFEFKSKLIYDRRSGGQSILVSGSHLEPMTRYFFLSDDCWFLYVGHLSDESMVL
jgi:hypothetical protein